MSTFVPNGFGEAGFLFEFPLPTHFFDTSHFLPGHSIHLTSATDTKWIEACPSCCLAVVATVVPGNPALLEIHGGELVFMPIGLAPLTASSPAVHVPLGNVLTTAEFNQKCSEIEKMICFTFTEWVRDAFSRLLRDEEWPDLLLGPIAHSVRRALTMQNRVSEAA